jgi:hypothetical protein
MAAALLPFCAPRSVQSSPAAAFGAAELDGKKALIDADVTPISTPCPPLGAQ